MRTPHVTRHRRGWKYQRAIPKALQAMVGKTIWTTYLGDVGEREAGAKARRLATEHDAVIATLRGLRPEERQLVEHAGGLEGFRSLNAQLEVALQGDLTLPDYIANFPQAEIDRARAAGVSHANLAFAAVKARQYAVTHMQPELKRRRAIERKLDRGALAKSLDELVDLWERVAKPRNPSTAVKYRRSFRMLAEIVPDVSEPQELTQDHIAKFRDANEASGASEAVQRKHLDYLRAVFKVAVSERVLDKNPAAGIAPRKSIGRRIDHVEKRKPFTGPQLRTVLAKVEETKWGGRRHVDVLWIMRLLTYTGARVNEIAQLRKEDVTKIDGVPVLMIRDASEGQTVKNNASIRNVPLHPECMAFLDYAARAHGPWVFRTMTPYSEGAKGGWIVRNFPEFRRTVCGIDDRKVTLHSIRHRFIDAARDAGVPDDRRKALVGHTEPGVHAKYGRGVGLKTLAREIAQVKPLAG